MVLSAAHVGEFVVVTATGELDMATSEQLRDCLADVVAGGGRQVVLDLSRVTFVDSTVLGVLVGVRNQLHVDGGQLTIVSRHPSVLKVFQVTGLDQVFPIRASLADAVS
jgi:anti-sigma B factor antagonist